MRNLLILLMLLTLCSSCLHRVSQDLFPATSSDIDYTAVKQRHHDRNANLKRGAQQEYYFELPKKIEETQLIDVVKQVLIENRFKDFKVDIEGNRVLGERGMTANEWNSICSVYYEMNDENYRVYVLFKMTQDMFGGFEVNKAEKVGIQLKNRLLQM